MKARSDAILRPAQAAYLDRLLPPREPLLRELEARAERDDVPISDPEVGRLLEVMARAVGAQLMLELGTAIGYGTLCLARAAPTARVITVDPDADRRAAARDVLARAGVLERVELVDGKALDVLDQLQRLPTPPRFDLVYIDAIKTEYRRCLDQVLPLLRVGGAIVVDNLLWKGWIAEPPTAEVDADTRAIAAFNGYFMVHPQLRSVILPLGDGVGLAVKTKALITEQGGPY